jgi:hypothetical protein
MLLGCVFSFVLQKKKPRLFFPPPTMVITHLHLQQLLPLLWLWLGTATAKGSQVVHDLNVSCTTDPAITLTMVRRPQLSVKRQSSPFFFSFFFSRRKVSACP